MSLYSIHVLVMNDNITTPCTNIGLTRFPKQVILNHMMRLKEVPTITPMLSLPVRKLVARPEE